MSLDILVLTHNEFEYGRGSMAIPTAALINIDFLIPILESYREEIKPISWKIAQGDRKIFHVTESIEGVYYPEIIETDSLTYIKTDKVAILVKLVLDEGIIYNREQMAMLSSLASSDAYLVLFHK